MAAEKGNTIERINAIRESKSKVASYVTFGVSLLITILLVVFALVPTITTITKINKEIKEKETITAQLKTKMDALTRLDEEYNESAEKFKPLQLVFPEEKRFYLLLSNMEAVVENSGFTLSSINFDSYDSDTYRLAAKVLTPSSMRIVVKGDSSDLLFLMRELEALPYFPVIESLSYSNNKDANGNTTFSIVLRIYSVRGNNFYK